MGKLRSGRLLDSPSVEEIKEDIRNAKNPDYNSADEESVSEISMEEIVITTENADQALDTETDRREIRESGDRNKETISNLVEEHAKEEWKESKEDKKAETQSLGNGSSPEQIIKRFERPLADNSFSLLANLEAMEGVTSKELKPLDDIFLSLKGLFQTEEMEDKELSVEEERWLDNKWKTLLVQQQRLEAQLKMEKNLPWECFPLLTRWDHRMDFKNAQLQSLREKEQVLKLETLQWREEHSRSHQREAKASQTKGRNREEAEKGGRKEGGC